MVAQPDQHLIVRVPHRADRIDAETPTYYRTTLVDIYGRRVEHTDTHILTRA